ncbi:MAG: hypothetical protein ABW078_08010 [Sedimenticola sp.]
MRIAAVVMTQLPIILFIAGSRDLLFGFNQTDAGFTTLVLLFLLVPVMNLVWITLEVRVMVARTRAQGELASFQMLGFAFLFFVEAIAIDLYLLSQVRM